MGFAHVILVAMYTHDFDQSRSLFYNWTDSLRNLQWHNSFMTCIKQARYKWKNL